MFKFYKCPVETHVNTSAKYDIVLYSITKVSGKRAQLFVQMLEKPKRTSSVCYRERAKYIYPLFDFGLNIDGTCPKERQGCGRLRSKN